MRPADRSLFVTIVPREDFPPAMVGAQDRQRFSQETLSGAIKTPIPPKGAMVGVWDTEDGDPFPDFMVVNDADFLDTYAWLSSYLVGLSPITQWCRIWPTSLFREIMSVNETPRLGRRLASWVGAIVAECNVQAQSNVNLRDLTGTAALTSAGYSAARSVALWGERTPFNELAKRHDEISGRLRAGSRLISAVQMLPLWSVLAGDTWSSPLQSDEQELTPFRVAVDSITGAPTNGNGDAILQVVRRVSSDLSLRELVACAEGPQTQRIDALDRLASRLSQQPKSPLTQATLGFGASLVDPGAAVLPELLRRYASDFPMAQIWTGGFAGAWSPARVLGDFQGLGRLIAKEITKAHDLFSKPVADIAFEEITRWVGTSQRGRVSVRGMVARSLNVELLPGITVPVPLTRDVARQESADVAPRQAPRQSNLNFAADERARAGTTRSVTSLAEVVEVMNDLGRRLMNLEEVVGNDLKGAKKRVASKPRK